MQRWHDLEARDVFARMQGPQMLPNEVEEQEEPKPALVLVGSASGGRQEKQAPSSSQKSHMEEIDEDDVDLEDLDEYEEYH